MAVSGGAIPCLEVWLDPTGALRTGYATHANGDAVDDDLLSVIRRIRAGERVLMHRLACNVVVVEFVIGNGLVEGGRDEQ